MFTASDRFRGRLLAHPLKLLATLAAAAAFGAFGSPASVGAIPDPIDPGSGEANLLELVNSLPINDIANALDNHPVPYVVVAQAGSGPPVIDNKNSGSPVRLDADSSKATGKGGSDIEVEVNTELGPPRLELEINRLGEAPFAEDLEVLVAFPFDAFNDESLPGGPNLFFGYETTASGGGDGGHAPLSEVITFTPDILAGTMHTFEVEMATTGSSNPLRFQAGHFDGDNLVGILNAAAMSAHVEPVPATIALTLTVDESALADPGTTASLFDIGWEASAPSMVVFDYVEEETPPGGPTTDYNTTLTVDQMPISEHLSVDLDEAAGTLVLAHDASAPIDEVTLLRERADGLTITGRATDVPTQVDLTLDLAGAATLDVNANTLDLGLVAEQTGGFLDTSDFLGYDVGYASVEVTDAPDLSAAYDAAADTFSVQATNPGESIGAVELVIGDDDALELPPSFADVPTHHIFSLVDDGTHGTAAARIVHLQSGTIDLNPTGDSIGPEEVFDFVLGEAAPLQAHLDTAPTSMILPGHDIEATCDVDDVPAGTVHVDIDFPTDVSYKTDPPTGIDSIHCFGHLDNLNFDALFGDLPPFFDWEYDPDGSATLRAQSDEFTPNSDDVGLIAIRLWDSLGDSGPGIPGTGVLLGEPLNEARIRVDDVPSFTGTWSDGAGTTAYAFDSGVPSTSGTQFLGGAQFAASTAVDLPSLSPAAPSSVDSARFRDLGAAGDKRMSGSVFGVDLASYSATDAPRSVEAHYRANADHQLVVDIDTTFGGRFFPGNDIDATLSVDAVPASFDFVSDLATGFDYTASSGIDSIGLIADIDLTNDSNANNTTHVDFLVEGLPSAAKLVVDSVLDPDANVEFTMASPIDSIDLLVTGAEGIFGSSLKQIDLDIDHIPANWVVTWSDGGGSIAAVGDKVDLISLIVSSELPDQNDAQRGPFTTGGGSVAYSAWLREIDRQWAREGLGDPNDRETDFMSRLDDIYGSTQNVAADEDRLLYRRKGGGGFQFFEFRLRDFQSGSFSVSDGAAAASLAVPFDDADTHPFYVGLGQPNGEFQTIQIANLPDSVNVDADTAGAGSFNFVTNVSAGRIEFYEGTLPTAGHQTEATKFILVAAPSEIHATWNFAFPGGATFDSNSPIEGRFLSQNSSTRVVGAVGFTDLSIGWGYETFSGLESGECNPLPPFVPCNEYFTVAKVSAEFNAAPPVHGMVLVYEFGNAVNANGLTPSSDGEYEPRVDVLLEGLININGSAGVRLCVIPLGFPPCPPGAILPAFSFGVTGSAWLDYWDDGGGPFNVLGDHDYVDNNPWNFLPLVLGDNDANRINPFD